VASLKLMFFAAHSLASKECSTTFYNALDDWDFPPDRYGEYEPIRTNWANSEKFLGSWRKQGSQVFGQVLVRRSTPPKYYADAIFLYGPRANYHTVSMYDLPETLGKEGHVIRLVGLADRLFQELQLDYGFICLDSEYDHKNILKNYEHDDGSIEPRKVVGMNWPTCLPGLYWINYFGGAYLNQGFGNSVQTRHPESVTVLKNGLRFQARGSAQEFDSPDSEAQEQAIKEELGSDWFFSSKTDGPLTGLNVSLEELKRLPF